MSKKLKYLTLIFLLIAAALLFFARLGDGYLWEDEAETAVISRNILTYGLPVTWDGRNQVTQEAYYDSNPQKVWTLQTWLPHYVTALSFKIFGVSAWSARLPFAVCGWFSVLVLFFGVYRQKKDFTAAFWSALLLAFSLTFILHARQSRYYALAVLLAVIWFFSYWRAVNGQSKSLITAILAGILLFHTQYFIALASWAAAGLSAGLQTVHKKIYALNSLIIYAFLALGSLPWIIYVKLWEKSGEMAADPVTRLSSWVVTLLFNLINLNHFIFPLLLLLAIVYLSVRNKLSDFDKYLFWCGVFYMGGISVNPLFPDIRYVIILVFWSAYFCALLLAELKNIYLQILLAVTLTCSNLLSLPFWLPVKQLQPELTRYYGDLRFDFFNYFYELTHEQTGPLKAFVKYRTSQGNKGRTIFVSYEAEPLIFHTDLKLLRELPFKEPPDWIILRGEKEQWPRWLKWVLTADRLTGAETTLHVWNYHQEKDNPVIWQKRREYIEQYLRQNHYKKTILPVQNTIWENRPTLLWHRFGNEKTGSNNLIIYSR